MMRKTRYSVMATAILAAGCTFADVGAWKVPNWCPIVTEQGAVKDGKATRPALHCGICGEHGGDPVSEAYCHKLGMD